MSNYRKGADRSRVLNPKYRDGLAGASYGAAGPCVSLVTGKVTKPHDKQSAYKTTFQPRKTSWEWWKNMNQTNHGIR